MRYLADILRRSVLAAIALSSCSTTGPLVESSTNFDLADVQPFLMRVAPHLEGFGEEEITSLMREASSLPLNATGTYSYQVTYRAQEAPLRIEVFMDDVDALDVYFFSTPEVAALIDEEMDAYFDELGM